MCCSVTTLLFAGVLTFGNVLERQRWNVREYFGINPRLTRGEPLRGQLNASRTGERAGGPVERADSGRAGGAAGPVAVM